MIKEFRHMKQFQNGLGWRASACACACAMFALLLAGCATEHHITDARHPEVAITPDGGVTYRGKFVDPEDLPKVKDKFYKANQKINGSGIGLLYQPR